MSYLRPGRACENRRSVFYTNNSNSVEWEMIDPPKEFPEPKPHVDSHRRKLCHLQSLFLPPNRPPDGLAHLSSLRFLRLGVHFRFCAQLLAAQEGLASRREGNGEVRAQL